MDYQARLAKTRDERCEIAETLSGIPVKPVYTPEDIKDIDYERDVGNPGEYPFTRGAFKQGYRGKLWTRRVFSGLGSPADANARFKYLIQHGETGLHVFWDTPGFWGIDPDHPLAEWSSGTTGLSACCKRDIGVLFEGIPLDGISIALIIDGYNAAPIFACYLCYAKERGYDFKQLLGSIVNDPLHKVEGLSPANCGEDLELGVKLCVDIIEYCAKYVPRFHPIAFNSFDWSQKGANAAQEVAFAFACMEEYFNAAIERGLNIDEFAPRANVYVCNADSDFFENIAKFRAARRLWAKLMREKYGAKHPRSAQLYLSAHTSGISLTAQQPANNIARIAIQALSCVLGSLQSFDPAGYDEAYFRLTEESALTSLNIQNIIAYETGVASVADPLAGSYYVEWLTNKLEEEIVNILKQIEGMGGFIQATKRGWIRTQIEKGALNRQKEIEEGRRIIVGVNDWTVPPEREVKIIMKRDQPVEKQIAIAEKRTREIKDLKARRDNRAVKQALENLRQEAERGKNNNLIPALMRACEADATMGEMTGVIRLAYGLSYDPFNILQYPF
jgi:methylmalonyl-CoA mutase N-terminal domain/subunit